MRIRLGRDVLRGRRWLSATELVFIRGIQYLNKDLRAYTAIVSARHCCVGGGTSWRGEEVVFEVWMDWGGVSTARRI